MNQLKSVIVALAMLFLLLSVGYTISIISITGATVGGTTQFCINPAPDINNLSSLSTRHSLPFLFDVNATDQNNDSFTFSDNTSLFNISSTGVINFTPNVSSSGNHSILLIATDNFTECAANGYEILLLQITNIGPTNLTIPNQTWEEDVWLTGLNLTRYFTDADNDTLNYSVTAGNNVTITINSLGIVTLKPQRDWYGQSWAIFRANDSIDYQDSNNVSLRVTQVSNFCGDGICNSNESCGDCSSDCGACPPSSGSSSSSSGSGSSGGGGGTRTIEKLISIGNGTCSEQLQCGKWLPSACRGLAQEQVCLTVKSDCSVIEKTETRDCLCEVQYECTGWSPQTCSLSETQERTCIDVNNCNKEIKPQTERECETSTVADAQISAKTIHEKDSAKELGSQKLKQSAIILIDFIITHYWLIALLFILAAIVFWILKGKNCYKIINRTTFRIDDYEVEIENEVEFHLHHHIIIEDLRILSKNGFYVYHRKRKLR